MDTQDMALLLIAGILLVALVVVNTATPGVAESTVDAPEVIKPVIPMGSPREGVTTMVFVYDPTVDVDAVVEVQ